MASEIDFRALCGENLATYPSDLRGNKFCVAHLLMQEARWGRWAPFDEEDRLWQLSGPTRWATRVSFSLKSAGYVTKFAPYQDLKLIA